LFNRRRIALNFVALLNLLLAGCATRAVAPATLTRATDQYIDQQLTRAMTEQLAEPQTRLAASSTLARRQDEPTEPAQDEPDAPEQPPETSEIVTAGPDGSTADLAKQTQNPVADLISVPFQNNTSFGAGPDNDVVNVLNFQPVVPMRLNDDWNLINRMILPVVYLPEFRPGTGDDFGLGDLQYTAFLSPSDAGEFVWGVGPALRFPTATDARLGSEKWSVGPSAVGVYMKDRWVVGTLAQHLFSFAGDSDRREVSELLVQPFVNYNLDKGWYLVSAPIITASWTAPSNDQWTVPAGGGVGRVFRIGKQPVNANIQAYYNVEAPDAAGDWTLRLQFQFLFPRG
jgi:hypothetical protein